MRDRLLLTVLLLALAAGFGWVAGATTPQVAGPTRCTHRELTVTLGPPVPAQTGEHAVALIVHDTAAAPCRLSGWPRVTLRRGARMLPFHFERGGGPYLKRSRPHPVTLGERTAGRIVVAKYRCDGRIAAVATAAVLGLPGIGGVFHVALPRDGEGGLALCRRYPGDAAVDPGNRVAVSPLQ